MTLAYRINNATSPIMYLRACGTRVRGAVAEPAVAQVSWRVCEVNSSSLMK